MLTLAHHPFNRMDDHGYVGFAHDVLNAVHGNIVLNDRRTRTMLTMLQHMKSDPSTHTSIDLLWNPQQVKLFDAQVSAFTHFSEKNTQLPQKIESRLKNEVDMNGNKSFRSPDPELAKVLNKTHPIDPHILHKWVHNQNTMLSFKKLPPSHWVQYLNRVEQARSEIISRLYRESELAQRLLRLSSLQQKVRSRVLAVHRTDPRSAISCVPPISASRMKGPCPVSIPHPQPTGGGGRGRNSQNNPANSGSASSLGPTQVPPASIMKANSDRQAFLHALMAHATGFKTFFADRERMLKRHQLNLEKHLLSTLHKGLSPEERAHRERMLALQANDEDAYVKLLAESKNERLLGIVKQTEAYMARLGLLVMRERGEELPDEEDDSNNAAPSSANAGTASLRKAKERYFKLTHRVFEEVVAQPSLMTFGQLREYQIKGLQWLASLYNNNLNGILADAMGLGKTVQTISLFAWLKETKGIKGPHLVVAPLSTLKSGWETEFGRWFPQCMLVTYLGSKDTRRALRQKWFRDVAPNETAFDVILTTDAFVMKDAGYLKKYHWSYLVVDEAHRLKNPKSRLVQVLNQSYKIKRRIALTGTPLQNDLQEVWALLNFVMPTIFNSSNTFSEWFNQPVAAKLASTRDSSQKKPMLTADALMNSEEQLLIIDRLHKVLRPFLLRREKTQVADEVPQKTEELIMCPLSGIQHFLYERLVSNDSCMNLHMQLRKACNHPYLFLDRPDDLPLDETIIKSCGKFIVLDSMLPKLRRAGHKVLIFTQMTKVLDLLEIYLTTRSFTWLRLDGSTPSDLRNQRIAQFNNPSEDNFCFILSTKAGGLGINLQAADTVIIYDSDWNPQNDLQAEARAHRIGQTREVRTLRFVTPGTIEQRILETAGVKLEQDALVIRGGMFDDQHMHRESERRSFLTQILQNTVKDINANSTECGLINRILARDDEGMTQLERIDKRQRLLHYPALLEDKVIPPSFIRALPNISLGPNPNVVNSGVLKGMRIGDLAQRDTTLAEANAAESWRRATAEGDFVSCRHPDPYVAQQLREALNMAIIDITNDAAKVPIFTPFIELVDPVLVPDYYNLIKKPVALDSIRSFARERKFTSLHKVEKYIERMAANCRLFNGSQSQIFSHVCLLIGFFLRSLRRRMALPLYQANHNYNRITYRSSSVLSEVFKRQNASGSNVNSNSLSNITPPSKRMKPSSDLTLNPGVECRGTTSNLSNQLNNGNNVNLNHTNFDDHVMDGNQKVLSVTERTLALLEAQQKAREAAEAVDVNSMLMNNNENDNKDNNNKDSDCRAASIVSIGINNNSNNIDDLNNNNLKNEMAANNDEGEDDIDEDDLLDLLCDEEEDEREFLLRYGAAGPALQKKTLLAAAARASGGGRADQNQDFVVDEEMDEEVDDMDGLNETAGDGTEEDFEVDLGGGGGEYATSYYAMGNQVEEGGWGGGDYLDNSYNGSNYY